MMILLNGHSLTAKNQFQPERMSLQLTERTSTASMTLSMDAPSMAVGDWLRSEDGPAAGIVWRVKSIDTQYDRNTRTVNLEHVIQALKDIILFGETKTENISGGATATADQTIRYILSRQKDWKLGAVERNPSKPYSFNGDDLYSALETVCSTMTECVWDYNFNSYPFTLNLRAINDTVASEMRTDRNIKTLRMTVDRTRMYTRFYPIGKDDLHIAGDYVGKNESKYGIICKTETDQSKETEGELRDWATERLNRHCDPIVTVTISGMDLSEATGEPLDSFKIGRYCRVPLPEFDTTINERVSKLSYTDVIHDPVNVTITLANELPDIANIIKRDIAESGSGGSGGRAAAKNAKEDHAWMVDTDDHIGLVAEAVAGEGADKDWSRVASVMVDGEGIHQRVVHTEEGIVDHEARIEVTEDSIKQTVTAIGKDGKITAASICLAINQAGSQANISADHIILTGKTTINDIMTIGSGRVQIKRPLRVEGDAMVETLTVRGGGSSLTLNESDLATTIKKAELTNSGKTLKLTPWRGDPINFEKAADLTGSWASGVFTAVCGDKSLPTSLAPAPGQATWDGNTVSIPIYATIGSSGVLHDTGKVATATIPDPEWSYSQYATESNSQPSGAAKSYSLDTRYTYHSFYVTVGGVSKLIVCRT